MAHGSQRAAQEGYIALGLPETNGCIRDRQRGTRLPLKSFLGYADRASKQAEVGRRAQLTCKLLKSLR